MLMFKGFLLDGSRISPTFIQPCEQTDVKVDWMFGEGNIICRVHSIFVLRSSYCARCRSAT